MRYFVNFLYLNEQYQPILILNIIVLLFQKKEENVKLLLILSCFTTIQDADLRFKSRKNV